MALRRDRHALDRARFDRDLNDAFRIALRNTLDFLHTGGLERWVEQLGVREEQVKPASARRGEVYREWRDRDLPSYSSGCVRRLHVQRPLLGET